VPYLPSVTGSRIERPGEAIRRREGHQPTLKGAARATPYALCARKIACDFIKGRRRSAMNEGAGIEVNIAFSRFEIFHIAGRMDFPIDLSHFTLGAVYSWGGTSGRRPESESADGERGRGNDRKG
jgi:hypothetical protein